MGNKLPPVKRHDAFYFQLNCVEVQQEFDRLTVTASECGSHLPVCFLWKTSAPCDAFEDVWQ